MESVTDLKDVVVLVVEDGNEYLESLSLCVPEPTYVQVHDGHRAIEVLRKRPVNLIYLDMRFDRIAPEKLLGGGSQLEQLQNHQGLYILAAIKDAGFGDVPIILAYDFSTEPARLERLEEMYPSMRWVPDAVTPEVIQELIRESLGLQAGA